MSVSEEYLDFVMEQLQTITICDFRKMFGGVGIYHATVGYKSLLLWE